ncbi:MAG: glycerophosphodiester phosphodiesterase [bacterium]
MKRYFARILLSVFIIACATGPASAGDRKTVIAHRGASGYLPEHSMAAKAMAFAMGADYIEQDVVMTKDNRLVVLHDHYLDRVTNVAAVFPDRQRGDGRFYVIDFTLKEILQLEMTEGFKLVGGKPAAIFPQRFPIWKSSFQVHTFEAEVELIQGLNKTMGRTVGIYPEIKAPAFHRHEGKDISREVLRTLKHYGYITKNDPIYLQCFDPAELKRIADELFPEFNMAVKLVQLIAVSRWKETMVYLGDNAYPYDFDWMFQPGAMKKVAAYADGIGPWKSMLVGNESSRDHLVITDMVREAHEAGMVVHAYTFRLDAGRIPPYASSFEDMLDIFFNQVGVDGVFTDFPDRAVAFLRKTGPQ